MQPFTSTTNPATIPAESRLLIETISVQVNVTGGHHLGASVHYTADGNAVTAFVPVTLSYREVSNYDTFHALVHVALYADAGTAVRLDVYSPDGQPGTSFLTLSGSLMDV